MNTPEPQAHMYTPLLTILGATALAAVVGAVVGVVLIVRAVSS